MDEIQRKLRETMLNFEEITSSDQTHFDRLLQEVEETKKIIDVVEKDLAEAGVYVCMCASSLWAH